MQATAVLAGLEGVGSLSVARVSAAAGVGSRTFYNYFADLADAFAEACAQMHAQLRQVIQAAYDRAPQDGDEGLAYGRARRCVEAVVGFAQADPVLARVLFVQSPGSGPEPAELRMETVEWLSGLVGGTGRSAHGIRHELLVQTAIGGVSGVLVSSIQSGDLEGLTELIPWMAELLVLAGRDGETS